jgi:hypothetical protein
MIHLMVFIGAILKPRRAGSDRAHSSPLIQIKPADPRQSSFTLPLASPSGLSFSCRVSVQQVSCRRGNARHFVAAMQTAVFPRVEEWTDRSVMAASNLRQAIEGLFAAPAAPVCVRSGNPGCSRRSARPLAWALAIPVMLLLIALLRCTERGRDSHASLQSPV